MVGVIENILKFFGGYENVFIINGASLKVFVKIQLRECMLYVFMYLCNIIDRFFL